MTNNLLVRVQKLADGVAKGTHPHHATAASVLRQLVSDKTPEHKWIAITNLLKKVPDDIQGMILDIAESIPEGGSEEQGE